MKRALEAPTTAYAHKDFKVFLQGSYGNDSNTYAEIDVDLIIRPDSIFYHDTSALSPAELAAFNMALMIATGPDGTKDDWRVGTSCSGGDWNRPALKNGWTQ